MYKKALALLTGAILAAGMLVGISAPAQAAAPDKQLTLNADRSSCEPGETGWCTHYDFRIGMKELFGDDGARGEYQTRSEVTYALYNSRGSEIDSGHAQANPDLDEYLKRQKQSYTSDLYPDNGHLANGRYTLRVKVFVPAEEEDCQWRWTSNYEYFYNTCDGDQPYRSPNETHYLTYSFSWNGKTLKANRQSFSASAKKTETTATTYTAKKTASYTGSAQYTSKQTAKVKRKGKTFKATASATTKKTHKVTKTATVKATKLKKKATVTAKVTSYHSAADAAKKASATASKDAKAKATKAAKDATNKKATSKAKSMITKKVKDDAKKKAKSKITKKVKTDTQKKAYNAALKAAKKKAGIK